MENPGYWRATDPPCYSHLISPLESYFSSFLIHFTAPRSPTSEAPACLHPASAGQFPAVVSHWKLCLSWDLNPDSYPMTSSNTALASAQASSQKKCGQTATGQWGGPYSMVLPTPSQPERLELGSPSLKRLPSHQSLLEEDNVFFSPSSLCCSAKPPWPPKNPRKESFPQGGRIGPVDSEANSPGMISYPEMV